ncbi:transglycosylase domain-containing protein [Geothrix sp. PMB-07]|uniref:transglycosylase domain-containing protein n=1 Tax=Geothrix sp. PMB-07 TaxID=3068640 RepID=UPI003556C629
MVQGLGAWGQQPSSIIATCPPLPTGVTSVTVLDSQGRYVGRIPPQNRYWATLDRIPGFLQQALLAVEDSRFYEHSGLDYRSIARAAMKDVLKGRMAEGGSTITQQLIKNKFLSSARTLDRKIEEAKLAMEFEKTYSKQQILEMYFNEIYYGNGAQGIVQAARLYFDKRPEELNEGECLLLAGVPKNPSRYNPFGKPSDVAGRRDVVLKRMEDLQLITPQRRLALQAHGAATRPLGQAPQYLAQIRAQLIGRLGAAAVEQGGLEVIAAMDLDLQRLAEQTLKEGVKRLSPGLQGALVCLDPTTGDVLAAVGDAEGTASAINRAFVSRRQPGSAIKPLIYANALEKGLTAASLWSDEAVAYEAGPGQTWKPQNYGREEFGELSLRQALAHSGNIITVKVLETVGVPSFVNFAGKAGLTLPAQNGLSLALGTAEVTLKDLVQAYTPLANAGMKAEARTILRIYDRRRQTWIENPPAISQAMSPAAAFITTQMLKDVLTYGTAKSLRPFSQGRPSAGKTGTTDNGMDAWFVGYTPNLLTGVWIGYDQPRPGGKGFTGGGVAAPIWERFMTKAVSSRPTLDFPMPETVVVRSIDPTTGLLAQEACPQKQDEFFVSGTEPVEPCATHGLEPLPQEETIPR